MNSPSQDPSDMPGTGEAGTEPQPENLAGFKNVVRLGYVSLFTDLSTEMILGLLPVFIHDQLGASYAIVGLIEGSAEAVNDFCRILTGVITDRIARRKPLVLLGYALSSFAKPLFALTTSWGQAFIVRATDRAGKGTRTSPRDALISDSIAKSQAGKAFGVQSSLDQVGAVLGPLIAFFAFPLIGFRGVFWLSFAPAIISLIILLFFVTETGGRVAWLTTRGSRQVLELNWYPKRYRHGGSSGLDHLAFEVKDASYAYRKLAKRERRAMPPFREGRWLLAYVKDPDGNWIELGSRLRKITKS